MCIHILVPMTSSRFSMILGTLILLTESYISTNGQLEVTLANIF